MDYAGRIRVFVASGLFVAAFVATLLLAIPELEQAGDRKRPDAAGVATPAARADQAADVGAADDPAGVPADVLLSDGELDDRYWAIDELGASPSDSSVQALDQVLASSGDYRERLRAVTALERILSSGEAEAAARGALERAAGDRNAEVASSASAALGGN
jgi:hypothetical protein